jgi:hypothetical protein
MIGTGVAIEVRGVDLLESKHCIVMGATAEGATQRIRERHTWLGERRSDQDGRGIRGGWREGAAEGEAAQGEKYAQHGGEGIKVRGREATRQESSS